MTAVAPARTCRVISVAALTRREVAVGFRGLDPPTQFHGIVIFHAGPEGPREDCRSRLAVKKVVHGRHGAVVQVGSGRPDAVQGRRLIAGRLHNGIVIPEPAALLMSEPALIIELSR